MTSRPTATEHPIAARIQQSSHQEEVNLVLMLRAILRYRGMVIGIVVVTTLVAIVAAFVMKPMYRSDVLLAPATGDEQQGGLASALGQLGGLASLAGVNIRSASNGANEAIAILRSRSFTETYINEERLMPLLFPKRWDAAKNEWIENNNRAGPTIADAYELFSTRIRTVDVDPKTGLITLRIEWSNPELAAAWANGLVDRLNQFIRDRDIAEGKRSLKFLDEELAKTSVIELRQGIFRLIEHQIERVMLANVRKDYAFRILDPAFASDPDKRIWPNRRLMAIVGVVLGLIVSMIAVFLRVAFDKRV